MGRGSRLQTAFRYEVGDQIKHLSWRERVGVDHVNPRRWEALHLKPPERSVIRLLEFVEGKRIHNLA